MKLSEYVDGLRGKKITVLGIGISNRPLIDLLLESGLHVTACDRSERSSLGGEADRFERKGAVLRLGENYLKGLDADVIFRTPGLRPDLPEITEAVQKGAVLTSEMEAFFDVCPCRIIAVTGSEGKTTTATIIARLLAAEGHAVHLGGNIGTPLLTKADEMKDTDLAVLELSSFQLMTMKKSPAVAVVTNMTPNHLDVHRNMAEYIDAKKNILRYQTASDTAVLNYDNDITRGFAELARGELRYFSRKSRLSNGVFLENGVIYSAEDGKTERVMDAGDILLPGVHNIENYMTAFAATRGLVSGETCRRVASEFGGVEHRCELVRTLRGVRYYNDSIATSPTPTIAGLRAFDRKVILIAGGKDKGVPFDSLGPVILGHVKKLFLTGLTAKKIRAAVENAPGYAGQPEIVEIDDFRKAVLAASREAKDGDIVYLSPASTSFDRFKNFEERGRTFKEIINGLE